LGISKGSLGGIRKDYLDKVHCYLWVGEKPLGKVNGETPAVLAIPLEGYLSDLISCLMNDIKYWELPEHD
jgi:hypothetical protein